MLKRVHFPHMLAAATLAILFSASVHSQTTAGAGAGGAAGASSATSGASDKSAGADKSAAGGALSKSDQTMMRQMAQANLAEIETGKLAQGKTKNEQIRTFAQQMIDDHTKAQGELEQLAQSKGVKLPAEPDSKHKAAAKKLEGLSGDAFDRAYMKRAGLNDHKQAASLWTRVKNKATDPDLKAYADKTLPTIEQHLKMAQQIEGAKPATSGAPGGADKGTSGKSGATGK